MKNLYKLLFITLIILYLIACTEERENTIEGLWLVEKVEAGGEVMTPVARWMRFDNSNMQESGNGWYKHSEGTYNYNYNSGELSIVNSNGYADPYEAFKVNLENSTMIWNRVEEGNKVLITLKRIEKIPAAPGDSLMGVWDLISVHKDGADITGAFDTSGKQYIYFRWDKLFTIRHSASGRLDGIYKIHAHKPEVEMVYYGDDCKREYWNFQFDKNNLILESVNDPAKIIMKYERIN